MKNLERESERVREKEKEKEKERGGSRVFIDKAMNERRLVQQQAVLCLLPLCLVSCVFVPRCIAFFSSNFFYVFDSERQRGRKCKRFRPPFLQSRERGRTKSPEGGRTTSPRTKSPSSDIYIYIYIYIYLVG
jgi:hypothetical protein